MDHGLDIMDLLELTQTINFVVYVTKIHFMYLLMHLVCTKLLKSLLDQILIINIMKFFNFDSVI